MVMVRSDKKHICLGCLGVFVVLLLENDVNFTFEYESGQKVGINENQNVIKKIYVNGTSI